MVIAKMEEFVVPVNYDLPHAHQLAAGRFDWITHYDNRLIFCTSPLRHLVPMPNGEINQVMTFIHLNRLADSEEVLAEMENQSLRPTVSVETLSFAKAHPDVQRRFTLVGLGSYWTCSFFGRVVLCLVGSDKVRYLEIGRSGRMTPWLNYCHFLAVRR